MKIEIINLGFVLPHKVPFMKRLLGGGRMRGIMAEFSQEYYAGEEREGYMRKSR